MSTGSANRGWIVAQIGSRQHYAVARALQRRGHLNRLYTDVWTGRTARALSGLSRRAKAFAARHHADIPDDKVQSFNAGGLLRQLKSSTGMSEADKHLRYLAIGRWFEKKVIADLQGRPETSDSSAAFLFNTGALGVIHHLRSRGVLTLVDQIDVARVEQAIVQEEAAKWPGWQLESSTIPAAYFDRLQQEWDAADGVVVNSTWTRDGLIRQGVDAQKIHVIPLAYEARNVEPIDRSARRDRKLRVLFLGQVVLRKGLPYLFEAARALIREPVNFSVVGFVGISREALATAPKNMHFSSYVPQSHVPEQYAAADVFVLPTMSDGFAITQIEAMAHGLPVIATPRCGDVVVHGESGLIVPAGDSVALAEAIGNLIADRDRLAKMSDAARQRSRDFSLDRFGDHILQLGK